MRKIILICLFMILLPVSAFAEAFPRYPGLEANVQFWQDIYSKYTTRQYVLHDNENLDRVYGSITLPSNVRPYTRAAGRVSDTAKQKYRHMLQKFARGENPLGEEEERVFRLFPANTPAQVFSSASRNIRAQLGQANRFKEGVIRSGLYLNHIRSVFSDYGLPDELSYLPHVESSFDYRAYSKFGAAGIWQFIRSTGRRYMKVGYTIDERRDPLRATIAAAKLLKANYEKLGSWPLAITAYNHGLAGMSRAAKHQGTNDYMTIFYNHKGRRFGFASRNFYPSFLAALEVSKNYKKYFGELQIHEPLAFEEYELPRAIDLNTLIAHLGLDREAFKYLNLGFRPSAYRYNYRIKAGYKVRVPIDSESNYPELLASLPNPTPNRKADGIEWVQVQSGDTLWNISQQLGVSLHELRVINDLSTSRIYAGQILKVPGNVMAKVKRDAEPKVAAIEPKVENRNTKPAAPPVERLDKASNLGRVFQAMVEPADKLDSSVGLWQGPVEPRSWHGSLAVSNVVHEGTRKRGVIKLEAEETLGHIAEWLEIPTQQIRNINGFSFSRPVRLGEKVRVAFNAISVEEFEQRRMSFHLSLQEDFHANYRVEGTQDYKVKRGDSIWRLSKDVLDAPVWLIQEHNPEIDLGNLQVGQKIVAPVVVPIES